MKDFVRENLSFSLCGLNCALCVMKTGGYCPGCGGGDGNQGCGIARCATACGGYGYCFECESYPCERYSGITKYDSFITHRNQLTDMQKAKTVGINAYNAALKEKADILKFLLDNYNDGRRKTFFHLAVNLLELDAIHTALKQIEASVSEDMPLKEKALVAVKYFEEAAKQKGVVLKLNKRK